MEILDVLDLTCQLALDQNTSATIKMLYLVGLGLSDETDITVKGLEIVKKASRVYLEAYTSILLVDQAVLVSPSHLERSSLQTAYPEANTNYQ